MPHLAQIRKFFDSNKKKIVVSNYGKILTALLSFDVEQETFGLQQRLVRAAIVAIVHSMFCPSCHMFPNICQDCGEEVPIKQTFDTFTHMMKNDGKRGEVRICKNCLQPSHSGNCLAYGYCRTCYCAIGKPGGK